MTREHSSNTAAAPVMPHPHPVRDRVSLVGGAMAMIGIAYLLIAAFLYGRFAPTQGPRWLAANGLALDIGALLLLFGGGLWLMLGRRERWGTRVFGLIAFVAGIIFSSALPADAGDAFGALEVREATVTSWTYDRSNGTPVARTSDGATFRWSENFAQYPYPRLGPGRYELTLTSTNHRLVGAVPIRQ